MTRPESGPQKFPSINKTLDSQNHLLQQNSEYQPFYLPQQKRYLRQQSPNNINKSSVIQQNQNQLKTTLQLLCILLKKKSFEYSRNRKDFSFINVADKSFEVGRTTNQKKNSFDFPKQKSTSFHQSNNIVSKENKQAYSKQKIKCGRFSKAASVLPPEIRNNPFADAVAITESEIYNGLYNLINKGIVPKDVDIMPAFSRGVPPLINKPMVMHEFKEKLIKQEINIEPKIDLSNIKLDIQPIQNKSKFEYKPVENQSQYSSQKRNLKFKQFIPINKQLDQSGLVDINQIQKREENELELQETQAKSYPEVLDTYSLHHLIVRKGKVVEETPEYSSYKRTYQLQWGQINQLLKEIEAIAHKYDFPLFYLDGKKLAILSEKMTRPTLEELLNCIVNQDMVDEVIYLN